MTEPFSILGINCAYHESSACLIQDGHLIAVAEEERFNRIKHAKAAGVDSADKLPEQAISLVTGPYSQIHATPKFEN